MAVFIHRSLLRWASVKARFFIALQIYTPVLHTLISRLLLHYLGSCIFWCTMHRELLHQLVEPANVIL